MSSFNTHNDESHKPIKQAKRSKVPSVITSQNTISQSLLFNWKDHSIAGQADRSMHDARQRLRKTRKVKAINSCQLDETTSSFAFEDDKNKRTNNNAYISHSSLSK